MIRRIAREMAMQSLFQIDVYAQVRQDLSTESTGEVNYADFTVEAVLAGAFAEHEKQGTEAVKAQEYAEKLVRGVLEHKEAIDEKIGSYAIDWSVERMSGADRNILRVAVYELFFMDKPLEPGIAINEAVEIAKTYGTDDAPRFINGVLGKMMQA